MEPRFECNSLSNPLTNISLPANRDDWGAAAKVIMENRLAVEQIESEPCKTPPLGHDQTLG